MIRATFIRAAAVTTFSVGLLTASVVPAAASPAAEKVMLKEKDVPASFGTPTSYDFDAKIVGKTIGICDNAEGRTLVSVPAPPTQYLAEVETKNKKTYTSVMERVYQFASADAAKASFDKLKSQRASCDGTTSMTNQQPSLTQTNSAGSFDNVALDNFWISNSGTWRGGELKKPSRTVLLAIYVQSGDAIVETVAYINGRGQLTGSQISDLGDLAIELGQRWAS